MLRPTSIQRQWPTIPIPISMPILHRVTMHRQQQALPIIRCIDPPPRRFGLAPVSILRQCNVNRIFSSHSVFHHWFVIVQLFNRPTKCSAHHRMITVPLRFYRQRPRTRQQQAVEQGHPQRHSWMIINENNVESERHLQVYNWENWKNAFNK